MSSLEPYTSIIIPILTIVVDVILQGIDGLLNRVAAGHLDTTAHQDGNALGIPLQTLSCMIRIVSLSHKKRCGRHYRLCRALLHGLTITCSLQIYFKKRLSAFFFFSISLNSRNDVQIFAG